MAHLNKVRNSFTNHLLKIKVVFSAFLSTGSTNKFWRNWRQQPISAAFRGKYKSDRNRICMKYYIHRSDFSGCNTKIPIRTSQTFTSWFTQTSWTWRFKQSSRNGKWCVTNLSFLNWNAGFWSSFSFSDIMRNRDFYRINDVRPPFTYASLIRQVKNYIPILEKIKCIQNPRIILDIE